MWIQLTVHAETNSVKVFSILVSKLSLVTCSVCCQLVNICYEGPDINQFPHHLRVAISQI